MTPWKVDGVALSDAGPANVEVHVARVTLTTAQVLALATTPITLVAAPGSGKVLRFVSAHLWLDYNSVIYDNIVVGDDLEIRYTDGSGAEVASVEVTGFLGEPNDEHRIVVAAADPVATPGGVEPVANSPLVIYLSGAILNGNSPLKVEIQYQVLPYTW